MRGSGSKWIWSCVTHSSPGSAGASSRRRCRYDLRPARDYVDYLTDIVQLIHEYFGVNQKVVWDRHARICHRSSRRRSRCSARFRHKETNLPDGATRSRERNAAPYSTWSPSQIVRCCWRRPRLPGGWCLSSFDVTQAQRRSNSRPDERMLQWTTPRRSGRRRERGPAGATERHQPVRCGLVAMPVT